MASAPGDTDSDDAFLQATPDSQALDHQSLDPADRDDLDPQAEPGEDKPYRPLNAGTPVGDLLALVPRLQAGGTTAARMATRRVTSSRQRAVGSLTSLGQLSQRELACCCMNPREKRIPWPWSLAIETRKRQARAKPSLAPHLRPDPGHPPVPGLQRWQGSRLT